MVSPQSPRIRIPKVVGAADWITATGPLPARVFVSTSMTPIPTRQVGGRGGESIGQRYRRYFGLMVVLALTAVTIDTNGRWRLTPRTAHARDPRRSNVYRNKGWACCQPAV